MKTMLKYRKSNLLSPKQREQIIMESAEKANLIMTICVLSDCFGFGKKRINEFVDRYQELAQSFQKDNENLKNINEEIWERFEVKIL